NQRIEHIGAAGDHRERLLHRGHVSTILESIPISRRNHKRLHCALRQNHRKTSNFVFGGSQSQPSHGTVAHEIAAFHFFHVVLVYLESGAQINADDTDQESASLILSAVLGPMPSTMSRPPPATNVFSSGREETLKRWCSSAAVFGPMPGISSRSSTVSGVSAVSR